METEDCKLKGLHLKNYKCFEHLKIELNDTLTVIVGINGSGKSTILSAMRTALGVVLYYFPVYQPVNPRIDDDEVRHVAHEIGGRLDIQKQLPCIIDLQTDLFGSNNASIIVNHTNSEGFNIVSNDNFAFYPICEHIKKQIGDGNTEIILPIISYYGTGRLWALREQSATQKQFTRFSGYDNCLDASSNQASMLSWFEYMTQIELQEQQENPAYTMPELNAVRSALSKCFERISKANDAKVTYLLKQRDLIVTYKKQDGGVDSIPFGKLSDGYRDTLSLFADIAYRMSLLNPQLSQNVLKQTPGIVLIDEVDLHLHPLWQQSILSDLREIFPRVQFIVTTHAPSVINSVKSEHLLILEDNQAYTPACSTYGRDVNAIMSMIMGTESRPIEIKNDFNALYRYIDDDQLHKANEMIEKLGRIIGEDDPELVGARVTLELEELGVDE